MKHILKWLPRDTDDTLARGRAGLVLVVCLGLALATLALLLVWLISGDLQAETVVGVALFILVLAGLAALARRGRSRPAAWALIILLALLITVDAASYGLGSPVAAAYFVPVALAACAIGLAAGIGVAAFSSFAIWAIAWSTLASWYQPLIPAAPSHLTFSAPLYTAMLLLVALIVGSWSRYLGDLLCRGANGRD